MKFYDLTAEEKPDLAEEVIALREAFEDLAITIIGVMCRKS